MYIYYVKKNQMPLRRQLGSKNPNSIRGSTLSLGGKIALEPEEKKKTHAPHPPAEPKPQLSALNSNCTHTDHQQLAHHNTSLRYIHIYMRLNRRRHLLALSPPTRTLLYRPCRRRRRRRRRSAWLMCGSSVSCRPRHHCCCRHYRRCRCRRSRRRRQESS